MEDRACAGLRKHRRAQARKADAASCKHFGNLIKAPCLPAGVANIVPEREAEAGKAVHEHIDVDKIACVDAYGDHGEPGRGEYTPFVGFVV